MERQKPKGQRPQYHRPNVNSRKQNDYRFNKKNQDWKEDYITISQDPKLERVNVETETVNE